MCNTMCNNHTHEEYNVDYIENEQALDITTENVPCSHEQNIYIVRDEENDQCNCNKCSKCDEPKKVSCRSLACQQLNDECSCKRNKKNIRKTTMVNVLENNVLRLEDKMNSGCADMHESIEDLEENVNKVYNELKDEEARAKQQEAFLHYGLDDAVTRAWYNPEDRKIHFYHKNPANCLNVNVNEGCDCDCCNACGCECKCNNDECQSDIPYTMDDNCNIIPMSRDEEELPFSIDCTDFLRDIFISNAYLEEGLVDPEGDVTHQFLIIEFTRYLEPELSVDDDQSVTPHIVRIDLTEIWKLDNYYDKWQIEELANAIFERICAAEAEINSLKGRMSSVENRVTNIEGDISNIHNDINNIEGDINNIEGDISNINETTTNLQQLINNINTDVPVVNNNPTLGWGLKWQIGTVKGQKLEVTMPADPTQGGSAVTINDVTLAYGESKPFGTINGQNVSITLPNPQQGEDHYVTSANIDQSNNLHIVQNGLNDVIVPLPAPGEGADGNDYVVSGTVTNNLLVLTRNSGATVPPIDLPQQQEMPRHITNITLDGDTVIFTWSSGEPATTTINVGDGCLWTQSGNTIQPVAAQTQVYGYGFYDQSVS